MAKSDYYLCGRCGNKCFYDAGIAEYDNDGNYLSSGAEVAIVALCEACAKTHKCIVVPRDASQKTAWAEDFRQRLWAKFTPALNTGTAMAMLVLVSETLREMTAPTEADR